MMKPDAVKDDQDGGRGKLRFSAPDGLDLEGKEAGGILEVVAELEIEKNGKLCLKKINGIPVGSYAADDDRPARSFAAAVTGDTSEDA